MVKRSWDKSNEATCFGKKIFNNYGAALSYDRRMHKRGSPMIAQGRRLERLHPYRCLKCGKYHLGHPSRKEVYH